MKNNSSKLTLGTVQLGLDYGIANNNGKPSLEKAFEILDSAINGGITSFDTAAAYGNSQEVLGAYFAQNEKAKLNVIITSKIRMTDDVKEDEVLEVVTKKTQDCLKKLKMNSLDYLMLHQPTDLYKYKGSIVDGLLKMKEKGYAKEIGVSVYTKEDLEEVLKYDGIGCVQLPINIIDTRLIKSGILKKLKDKNIYVFARSIFLQGLFFKDVNNLPTKLLEAKKYINKLNTICASYNITMAELALCYVRDIEGIDNLVIGAETPKQVIDNIKLVNGKGLPEEELKKLYTYFIDVPEVVLNPSMWA